MNGLNVFFRKASFLFLNNWQQTYFTQLQGSSRQSLHIYVLLSGWTEFCLTISVIPELTEGLFNLLCLQLQARLLHYFSFKACSHKKIKNCPNYQNKLWERRGSINKKLHPQIHTHKPTQYSPSFFKLMLVGSQLQTSQLRDAAGILEEKKKKIS